jgi:phosphatidylglycerophosphate synthase
MVDMSSSAGGPRRVLIVADESADWEVAGLRQLDRLALAVNEAAGPDGRARIVVRWNAEIAPGQRWQPTDVRLTRIEFGDETEGSFDLTLNTRSVPFRNALDRPGCPLTDRSQIPRCERALLRDTGKSQDGLVSRFLNRPISRAVTLQLLRYPITPSVWTLLIVPLPLIASLLLLRGSYAAICVGLLLFHLYSVLDGCDGEIARAKFLESDRGRRLDALCDIGSNVLLALALGFGLGGFFAVEGIAVAALIALHEWFLAAQHSRANARAAVAINSALYPRQRDLWERSGIGFLGEKVVWWLVQLTKRDVAMLVFVVLAFASRPAWILHLLGAAAAIGLGLALKARSGGNES